MSEASGLVVGEDGRARSPWATTHPLLREYYDNEWGLPVHDERGVFERICLEGFQSGLSWLTILRKREAFRAAFENFEPDRVALYDESDVDRLMGNAGIVRHRGKIESAVKNARATIKLRDEGGVGPFVWSFKPAETPMPRSHEEVPTQSPESVALSKALRERGYAFVGPTTMYALMEAIGVVDTHIVGSHRRGSSGVWPK